MLPTGKPRACVRQLQHQCARSRPARDALAPTGILAVDVHLSWYCCVALRTNVPPERSLGGLSHWQRRAFVPAHAPSHAGYAFAWLDLRFTCGEARVLAEGGRVRSRIGGLGAVGARTQCTTRHGRARRCCARSMTRLPCDSTRADSCSSLSPRSARANCCRRSSMQCAAIPFRPGPARPGPARPSLTRPKALRISRAVLSTRAHRTGG